MKTISYQAASSGMTLVILEQGDIRYFRLEGKARLTMGRMTSGNVPDIILHSPIAGRLHGEFLLIDGEVFYCDKGSINGTFYNGNKITTGMNKKITPIMLKSGDILRIDYEDLSMPDSRGVWILVIADEIQGEWMFFSFKGHREIIIGRDKRQCDIV